MSESKICTVGGFPINHSLTPHLFALVHEHLGLGWNMPLRIKTERIGELIGMEKESSQPNLEFKNNVERVTKEIEGDNFNLELDFKLDIISIEKEHLGLNEWGSITSPLKHQVEGSYVNCYTLDERGLRFAMTDGYGVVLVAKLFGVDFNSNPILSLKGGGSAALSTASAWLNCGGKINQIIGKRALPEEMGPRCFSNLEPDLYVDFDDSSDSRGLVLFPKYEQHQIIEEGKIDGRWMLVSQHLLAWKYLFSPENCEGLPSIKLLFKRLVYLESLMDDVNNS